MLELNRVDDRELQKIISFISEDNLLLNTFGVGNSFKSRILNSCYACFITLDGINIGFINIVDKFNNLEIDMGISSLYRGNGYGTKALGLLKNNILNDINNIIIQTKINNIAANKSIINNNFRLIKKDNGFNYYSI